MSNFICSDCKNYVGNCGKHFMDGLNHINYSLPSESYYAHEYDDIPTCFEPSEFYLEKRKADKIKTILEHYTVDDLEMALAQLEYDENN